MCKIIMKNLEIKEILIDLILSIDDKENSYKLNTLLNEGLDPNVSFSFDESNSCLLYTSKIHEVMNLLIVTFNTTQEP